MCAGFCAQLTVWGDAQLQPGPGSFKPRHQIAKVGELRRIQPGLLVSGSEQHELVN